jgi:hypothetical protein
MSPRGNNRTLVELISIQASTIYRYREPERVAYWENKIGEQESQGHSSTFERTQSDYWKEKKAEAESHK